MMARAFPGIFVAVLFGLAACASIALAASNGPNESAEACPKPDATHRYEKRSKGKFRRIGFTKVENLSWRKCEDKEASARNGVAVTGLCLSEKVCEGLYCDGKKCDLTKFRPGSSPGSPGGPSASGSTMPKETEKVPPVTTEDALYGSKFDGLLNPVPDKKPEESSLSPSNVERLLTELGLPQSQGLSGGMLPQGGDALSPQLSTSQFDPADVGGLTPNKENSFQPTTAQSEEQRLYQASTFPGGDGPRLLEGSSNWWDAEPLNFVPTSGSPYGSPQDILDSGEGREIKVTNNFGTFNTRQFTDEQLSNMKDRVFQQNYSIFNEREPVASGGWNDPNKMTAASKQFPSNSNILLFNEKTGDGAVVRINDTGPFVQNRDIDITPAAQKAVGAKQGLGTVQTAYVGSGGQTGYLGKFGSAAEAVAAYRAQNTGSGNYSQSATNPWAGGAVSYPVRFQPFRTSSL